MELMNGPDVLPLAKKPHGEWNLGDINFSEVMDQRIWKEFPEELLEAVIARLPIPTFFRFRTVCRNWNSLLSSPTFSQLCAQVSQAQPWFYAACYDTFGGLNVEVGVTYDPCAKKWRYLPIPSLQPEDIFLPVASAGGLVCVRDTKNELLGVCNPLIKSWKQLPPRTGEDWCRISVGMVMNGKSTTEGYKILWVTEDGDFDVYESIENSWTRPGILPQNIKRPLWSNLMSYNAVSSRKTIYFLRSNPEGILSYDMVSRVWKQFLVPFPPNSSDHSLAVCGDRIMLAALVKEDDAACLCLWQLQKMMLLWNEVDRIPKIWCSRFDGRSARMFCFGNRDLLMLSFWSRGRERGGREVNLMVTYHVLKREWSTVPACVFLGQREPFPRGIAFGTEFYPSLSAVP